MGIGIPPIPIFFWAKCNRKRMGMGTTAIFIDGGYLDKVLRYDHSSQRIDYEKFSRLMSGDDELLRTYYYHCLPYKSKTPTDDEKSRFASMHRFITALSFLPRYEVRLGRLVYRGTETSGEPIFIQKRVDCMVGVDMALLAGKHTITNVALCSGDSDLIPAISAVKQEGVLTSLWHGSFSKDTSPSRELVEMCDERYEITQDHVASLRR